jgi:hypothetical protein
VVVPVPMVPVLPFHVLPAPSSWSAMVLTAGGYTQPIPSAWPSSPIVPGTISFVAEARWEVGARRRPEGVRGEQHAYGDPNGAYEAGR